MSATSLSDRFCPICTKNCWRALASRASKPFGQSQVDELEDLKGRIEAATPLWADAPKELATVQKTQTEHDRHYDPHDRLEHREEALCARNVAKD